MGSRGNNFATLFEWGESGSGLATWSGYRLGRRQWRARLRFLLGQCDREQSGVVEVEASMDGGFDVKYWRKAKWGGGIQLGGLALLILV